MTQLGLAFDEGIKLQTTSIQDYDADEDNECIREIYLTNKNIICVYEKSTGFFSKPEVIIRKWSLNTIKNIGGKIQVSVVKSNFSRELQLLFIDGTIKRFSFYNAKKDLPMWEKAIIDAAEEYGLKSLTPSHELSSDFNLYQETNEIKSAFESQQCPGTAVKQCSSCGAVLHNHSKFCSQCGANVVLLSTSHANTDRTKRREEYAGIVLKCPHCAAVVTEMTAVCPECGLPISKKDAVSSVQAFQNKLAALENNRKSKSGGPGANFRKPDSVDVEKLSMIRNYPIPNSIDDIAEFMLLAISNIDVVLSKKTFANALYGMNNSGGETAGTIDRTISNAWVSKMEQCYRKAEIAFPNHPAFETIKQAYEEKTRELQGKGLGSFFGDVFRY